VLVVPGTYDRERLESLRRLAAMLGAHLLIEEGDPLDALKRVTRERGTTYILLGPPPRRARTPLVLKILRELPELDVRVVARR